MSLIRTLLFSSFVLLVTLGNVTAQNGNNEITIKGKISGFDLDINNNVLEFIFNDVLEDRMIYLSEVKPNGSFTFSFTRPYAQGGMLIVGNELYSFFAAPGDLQHFEINYTKNEIEYTGSNAEFNRNVRDYYQLVNNSQLSIPIRDSILRTSKPNEYRKFIEKQSKSFSTLLNRFFAKNNCSSRFRKWAITEQEYMRLAELMRYRKENQRKNKISRDSFLLTIPKAYFSFLEKGELVKQNSLQTNFFYTFLGEFYSYQLYDMMPKDSAIQWRLLYKNGEELASFKLRARQLIDPMSPFVQDLLLARFYHQVLEWGKTIAFDSLVKDYPIKEKKLSQLIQLKYEKVKALQETYKKPNTIYSTESLKSVTRGILDTIAKQHKGKVLYIDFWAPWCIPCMNEVPYAKKIKDKIDAEKIVFIYLGVDCASSSWEKIIVEKEMEGEHYLLNAEQYDFLKKQFKIKGIPHYVVLGTNGKVALNNAPKPRKQKELLELFDQLTPTKP